MSRLVVIGLDCAPPSLVFDRYADVMPCVSALRSRGTWGALRSSRPPITVPAWTCMTSGRDAGELGLYGFRLLEQSYRFRLAESSDVRVKRVWDWLGEQGFAVAPLFVPLTSPPSPVRGHMVSGCLWPGADAPWCFPRALESELRERFGEYVADVSEFRTDDSERVLVDLDRMLRQHFDIARYIWKTKAPDFMMLVEIGVDRLHHALWQHMDPAHSAYVAGNAWEAKARAYYGNVDREIAALLATCDAETNVIVVSDHGARAMRRGFCINQWLMERGDLVLRRGVNAPTRLEPENVDWKRTRAWAAGGYYARIFLNVEGRDPEGLVKPSDAESVTRELAGGLGEVRDGSEAMRVDVDLPRHAYKEVRGRAPDLMVYLDDLATRAIGSVGHEGIFIRDNDTGPDGCNHDWSGIFVLAGPDAEPRGEIEGAEITDVARTVLGLMRAEAPPRLGGRDWSR